MLNIDRRYNESLLIGEGEDTVEIICNCRSCKLVIKAPPHVKILRKELKDRDDAAREAAE